MKLNRKLIEQEPFRMLIPDTQFYESEVQSPCLAFDLPHPRQGRSPYANLYGEIPTYQSAFQVLQSLSPRLQSNSASLYVRDLHQLNDQIP